jgi:adenylosuccinate synthase
LGLKMMCVLCAGIPHSAIGEVVGVVKAYTTRVGKALSY